MLLGRIEESGNYAHLTRKGWIHLWVRNHSASARTKGDAGVPSHWTEVDIKTRDVPVNTAEIARTHKILQWIELEWEEFSHGGGNKEYAYPMRNAPTTFQPPIPRRVS